MLIGLASDIIDGKLTSDYAFLLNGGVISWKNKKYTYTILSTLKSEFVNFASVVFFLVEDIFWAFEYCALSGSHDFILWQSSDYLIHEEY